ncbi:MAG: PorT family protein [Paludibacter sp.]|nr:PorT family protein [Paludibacter sp.]
MNRIFLSLAVMVAVSFGQIFGQTITTSQSQNTGGKIETYTRTETVQPDGRSITTTTTTSTANVNASFGIKASANMSDFVIRNSDNYQINMKPGVSAGIFLKLENKNFAFHYELWLRYKTFEMKNTENQTNTDYQYWSLELPIYFMGQINTSVGKVFIGAGPYVSLGLDGKQDPGNIDIFYKNATTGKPVMQRWDVGLGATAGFEFNNGIIVFAGYQFGFINALHIENDDLTMKNRTINFGIGYKF